MMDVHNAAAELHESSLASVRHAALCCFVAISWRWQWNRIAPLPVLWRLNMAEEKLAGLNEQPQQDLGDYPAAIHELQRTVQQTHQELLVALPFLVNPYLTRGLVCTVLCDVILLCYCLQPSQPIPENIG